MTVRTLTTLLAILSLLPADILAAPAPKVTKGSVVGSLIDKVGKPVADVDLKLYRAPTEGNDAAKKAEESGDVAATVKSDAAGKFAFKDIVPGSYCVVVRVDGKGDARRLVNIRDTGTGVAQMVIKLGSRPVR